MRRLIRKIAPFFRPRYIFIFLSIIAIVALIAGHSGFYVQAKIWLQGRELRKRIEAESKRGEFLSDEIKSLSDTTNLSRMEIEARKKGMAKKDEIIILVK